MKVNKHQTSGFTIIEVLVAVGVLAVGSLAFLPSFTGASKQKALIENVENAKDILATVRTSCLVYVGNPDGSDKYSYSGVKYTHASSDVFMFRSTVADTSICEDVSGSEGTTGSTSTGSYLVDAKKVLSNGVVSKIPAGESPKCIFFKYGTCDSYVTSGTTVPGNPPAERDVCND